MKKTIISIIILLIGVCCAYGGQVIVSSGVSGINVTSGKTLTVTEDATIGANLGTAAYTASTAYQAASANLTPLASNLGTNLTGVNAATLNGHADTYFQIALDLLKGTYTNGYLCTYTTTGTLLDCNTNPASFQTASGNLDVLANITLQSFMQTYLGSANAGDARTNIGLGAADNVTFNSISGDGSALTGITVSGMRTDNASASHIPYIDAGGNVDDLELSGALSETSGTLTVRQLVDFTFADNDAAVTVSASKKGYVVPSTYNGSNVTEMTCSVYNRNSATANSTIINLIRERAGNLTAIFTSGVNIAYASFFANATDTTANAALQTGDIILFGNVTNIADPAPLGLVCTFTITK